MKIMVKILLPLKQYKSNIVDNDSKNIERESLIGSMEPCPEGEIGNICIEFTVWFWDAAYGATFVEKKNNQPLKNEGDKARPNEQSIDSNSGMIEKISNMIFDLKLFRWSMW